jgi:hypothetical protein
MRIWILISIFSFCTAYPWTIGIWNLAIITMIRQIARIQNRVTRYLTHTKRITSYVSRPILIPNKLNANIRSKRRTSTKLRRLSTSVMLAVLVCAVDVAVSVVVNAVVADFPELTADLVRITIRVRNIRNIAVRNQGAVCNTPPLHRFKRAVTHPKNTNLTIRYVATLLKKTRIRVPKPRNTRINSLRTVNRNVARAVILIRKPKRNRAATLALLIQTAKIKRKIHRDIRSKMPLTTHPPKRRKIPGTRRSNITIRKLHRKSHRQTQKHHQPDKHPLFHYLLFTHKQVYIVFAWEAKMTSNTCPESPRCKLLKYAGKTTKNIMKNI